LGGRQTATPRLLVDGVSAGRLSSVHVAATLAAAANAAGLAAQGALARHGRRGGERRAHKCQPHTVARQPRLDHAAMTRGRGESMARPTATLEVYTQRGARSHQLANDGDREAGFHDGGACAVAGNETTAVQTHSFANSTTRVRLACWPPSLHVRAHARVNEGRRFCVDDLQRAFTRPASVRARAFPGFIAVLSHRLQAAGHASASRHEHPDARCCAGGGGGAGEPGRHPQRCEADGGGGGGSGGGGVGSRVSHAIAEVGTGLFAVLD
jgi:hypothetical protein